MDRDARRRWRAAVSGGVIALAAFLNVPHGEAEPVAVKLPEGVSRGFLVLRTLDGMQIATGELVQKPAGANIDSRLFLNFKDGSLYDETVVFSQKRFIRVESYRLVQKGPSYPLTDVAFQRSTGTYRARTQDKKGAEEKVATGQLEMPADLYNGMTLTLIKNSPSGASINGQIVAFLPEPRLIKMTISPEGEGHAHFAGVKRDITRYMVKFDIGGLTGVVASIIGKDPPVLRYWVARGDVLAFVRFEGAMYVNGPVWRLEMAPLLLDQ